MNYWVTYPLTTHPYNPEFRHQGGPHRASARPAEAAGIAGIGFTDHPAPTERWLKAGGHDALDPFAALSFCAAVTDTLRLIPNILVLPYRNPFLVAKRWRPIDALSGGRFTLSVATGYLRGEYRALGVDFDQRNARFDEAIEVILRRLEGGRLRTRGVDVHRQGSNRHPKPHRSPHLDRGGTAGCPAAGSPATATGGTPSPRRGCCRGRPRREPLETVDDLRLMLDELWRFVDEAGRDRAEIDVVVRHQRRRRPGSDRFARRRPTGRGGGAGGARDDLVRRRHAGDSLIHAVESLERFGESVIRRVSDACACRAVTAPAAPCGCAGPSCSSASDAPSGRPSRRGAPAPPRRPSSSVSSSPLRRTRRRGRRRAG